MVELQEKITAAKVFNGHRNEYACDAYSFPFPPAAEAKKVFNEPVDNTICFAGEALSEGKAFGTVETALMSGKEVTARGIKNKSYGFANIIKNKNGGRIEIHPRF